MVKMELLWFHQPHTTGSCTNTHASTGSTPQQYLVCQEYMIYITIFMCCTNSWNSHVILQVCHYYYLAIKVHIIHFGIILGIAVCIHALLLFVKSLVLRLHLTIPPLRRMIASCRVQEIVQEIVCQTIVLLLLERRDRPHKLFHPTIVTCRQHSSMH